MAENTVSRAPVPEKTPTTPPGGNRMRTRLVRLGVRSVGGGTPAAIEPLLQAIRSNHPKADVAAGRAARTSSRRRRTAGRCARAATRTSRTRSPSRRSWPSSASTASTLAAALLHDTVEDTDYSLDTLRGEFGEDVALLVDGVTKLDKVKYGDAAQAETVRKMVVAMSRDIRVLVIKLADRLHNARTWKFVPAKSAESKARETLEIYAPLAHRLGMNTIKWELEDLSFADPVPQGLRRDRAPRGRAGPRARGVPRRGAGARSSRTCAARRSRRR